MLRDYQSKAISDLRAELRAGRRRVLLTSPTGSGKSLLIASMVSSSMAKGKRAVFIAHRQELISQISERLTRDGLDHGVMMGASSHGKGKPVQICSIQTLNRRDKPPANLLLVDEAHRAAAKSYLRAFEAYPGVPVIGYTASPWRSDNKGLGDLFESNIVAATPAQLIKDGWLCRFRGFAFMAPDMAEVKIKGNDFEQTSLAMAYKKSAVYADIVDRWKAHAGGRQTIAFCASIEASQDLVARFRAAGIDSAHLDYKSLPADRFHIIQAARRGEITVLSNVGLYSEGLDIPSLGVCILARPTQSLALYLQMIGRVMRPKADGSDALILDHAENVARHGLPDAERDYSLKPGAPPKLPALTTCRQCLAIWQRTPEQQACPSCGLLPVRDVGERTGPDQVDQHTEVDLRDVGKFPSRAQQLELFESLLVEARLKGYKPGYAIRRFVEKYPKAAKPWGAWRRHVQKDGTWRSAT